METQEFKLPPEKTREQHLIESFRRANIRFVKVLIDQNWNINSRQVEDALQEADIIGEAIALLNKNRQ